MRQTEKRAELEKLEQRAAGFEQEGRTDDAFDLGVEIGYLRSTVIEEGDAVLQAGQKWTVGKIDGVDALIHQGMGRVRTVPLDDLRFFRGRAGKMDYSKCPACGGEPLGLIVDGVKTCSECEGFFGEVTYGVYRQIVKPRFAAEGADGQADRYFDFVVNGMRYHGWIDGSGCIVQIG